jgi:hypothetical protein
MKTLSVVRGDVRDRLNEATAREWTDGMLTRWINDATRDIARRSECLLDRQDITAIAGTQEYALPSNTVRVDRIEWRPSGSTQVIPLEYMDFNNADAVWWTSQTVSQGTPGIFTTWGFPPNLKLVVYPTPGGAGTFKCFYYRLPTAAAADGDTVEVPEGWEDAIAEYAEAMALRRDGDPRWQEAKQLYEENVSHLIDVTRRFVDQAGAITVGTTQVPGWLWQGDDY